MALNQISHFHVFVKDRPLAVAWLKKIWEAIPVEEDHEMSMFVFSEVAIVINDREEDVPSIIAFKSEDCDVDYKMVMARGAISIHEPNDKPWGVRIAFIEGPGELTFEIEQVLRSF